MKWRVPFVICLSLLLPLPLVWLLWKVSWNEFVTPQKADSLTVVPMLSHLERQGLLTYGRACKSDADCDPRLRCYFNMLTSDKYCSDSWCVTDQQCKDGFACQTYTTASDKDLIRFCSLVGDRKEGEVCDVATRDRQSGCERGLLCHHRCGRPCRLEEPASCPEGFFCEDDPTGPACQPTCLGRTCPEGQRCVTLWNRLSVCAQVHGEDCQLTPCAQNQVCMVSEYPQSGGQVWMRCAQRCAYDDTPPCPEDSVCVLYRCRKTCTPEDPSVCGEGFTCGRNPNAPDTDICVADVGTQN